MGCHEHVMYCNESIVMYSEESPRIHMTKKNMQTALPQHTARLEYSTQLDRNWLH